VVDGVPVVAPVVDGDPVVTPVVEGVSVVASVVDGFPVVKGAPVVNPVVDGDPDIGIVLINQFIAEMIRHVIDAHNKSLPAVLEIPSKEHPYDASKDSILRRARGMFTAEDLR
uniref:V-ATPase 14 kDa subunit n=1 Tax=Pseudonaja textilis TaxID=8673 RepID=A0A670ZQU5_PSETE